jgi:hypothetical protein
MMAAREECAKWILLHCWTHLDQNSRIRIFNHRCKHTTAGVFYFLSGQLQAIDFAIGGLELLKKKDPQISEASAALIDLLPKTIGDPESIAKAIASALHLAGDPNESKEAAAKREAGLKKLVDEAEELRQNSIYVDFNEDLQICGQPKSVTKDDYLKTEKDVVLAIFHIDKLSGKNPSTDVLHSTFPEWKEELENSLKKLATRLEGPEQNN